MVAALTLEAIAEAVLAARLATVDELGELVDELSAFAEEEDGTLMSFPARRTGLGAQARLVIPKVAGRTG